MASMESTDGLTPAQNNTYNFGTTSRKWKDAHIARIITAVINNGSDIAVPVTNTPDTLALKSEVDNAANSGRMITDEGVWFAKMYAASVVPTGAEYDGKNYADFSQTDGDGNPVIKIYTGASGAWTLTDTITPPTTYDGYVPVTKKIWDILDQTGQQGGRILWNHQSKTFTPFPNMVSFEDAALTGTPTAPTPTGASPNNQIANKDYVNSQIAASAATKANVDMDNLTSVGKNIANWSSNVSNCITEIPQDIKLELNAGTLTLKAGSKVYVPNGDGVFNEITVSTDVILNSSLTSTYGNGDYLWCYNPTLNKIQGGNNVYNQCQSGTYDGTQYCMFYDTTNNVIKYTADSGSTWESGYSLPFALTTLKNGVGISSIDQVFNGFGYIGSTIFALPGVKGLKTDGRNADGTLKSIPFTLTEVKKYDSFNTGASVYAIIHDSNNELGRSSMQATVYDYKNNYIYRTNGDGLFKEGCIIARATTTTNGISNFEPNYVFHTLDYNDSEYIAHCAMPGVKTMSFEPASGQQYIAPADGYFVVRAAATAAGKYLELNCSNNGIDSLVHSGAGGLDLAVYIPVAKGYMVNLYYSTNKPSVFKFVYANGATGILV